ncbi:MAG TPA: TPM domain-containing protein [Nocardioidaceae bacterium]|nr:TPM domain-containing protein [Nocardioidaceae bacterium]
MISVSVRRVVCAGLMSVFLLPAAPAAAVEPASCTSLVIDGARVLDVPKVRRAALAVQREAADIRVRSYTSVLDGDLDAQIEREQEACPSWRDLDGSRRDNLIVLAVSVEDRRVGLYYGRVWDGELGDRWPGIQAHTINPHFKAGRYTEGFVAGLRVVAREINPLRHPSGEPDEVGAVPGGEVFFEDSSTGGGGFGVVITLMAVVALAGAVLTGLGRGGRFSGSGRGASTWGAFGARSFLGPGSRPCLLP